MKKPFWRIGTLLCLAMLLVSCGSGLRSRTVAALDDVETYINERPDFSELIDEMLAEIEWKLNHRPRKSLGYRTPLEYCKQLFNFDF